MDGNESREITIQLEIISALQEVTNTITKVDPLFTDLQIINFYKPRWLCRTVNVRTFKLLLYTVPNNSA